jgi:hypothetical protein
MKRDSYADLLCPPIFSLESSLVAGGETIPIAQRDGTFGDGTAKVRAATPATHAALHDHYADRRPGVKGKQSVQARLGIPA